MPHVDCGVSCTIGYLQDLRQAPNLLEQKRPVCTLLHSLIDIPEWIGPGPIHDRICTNRGFRAELDGWEDAGTVETCTPEEGARQNAAVMHTLGIGPPPPKLPLIQRIRETLFGRPKPVDPSEKYPPIEIA